jgi:hypothetical protein
VSGGYTGEEFVQSPTECLHLPPGNQQGLVVDGFVDFA